MYSRKKGSIGMKSREKIIFLLGFVFMVFNCLLYAQGEHNEDPHYEWFEGAEVAIREDGIYADSNKGMIKLNVVEYDRINNRYKIICSCLQRPGLDSGEALSVPYEDVSE